MKRIVLSLTASLFAVAALAQERDLNKQVVVSKDYTPYVREAVKLSIQPERVDTVMIHPDIDFAIRPTPYTSGLGLVTIKPAQVSTWAYRRLTPFYLKLGVGYPLQSMLDFYACSVNNKRGYYGMYINHTGRYADIENDLGEDVSAKDFGGSGGVYASKRFNRFNLDGEIGYDYRQVDKYGLFEMSGDPLIDYGTVAEQQYKTIRGNVRFGNSFTDFSFFNIRGGVNGYLFEDKHDYNETGLGGFVEVGDMMQGVELTLKASYDGYRGQDNLSLYENNIWTVAPRFKMNTEKVQFEFGFDFVADGKEDSHFFPDFKVALNMFDDLIIPYLDVSGNFRNNGYRNTVLQNPYIKTGWTMENTAEYNYVLGITGGQAPIFSYRAYLGYLVYNKQNFLVNLYANTNTGEFVSIADKLKVFTVGAEADIRLAGSFSMGLAAHTYSYSLKNLSKAGGMANFDLGVDFKYNYFDKLSVNAGIKFIGPRTFFEVPDVGVGYILFTDNDLVYRKHKSTFDINIEATYKINETVSVFLRGNNLAGAKLLDYNHYPRYGANAMAGVTLNF